MWPLSLPRHMDEEAEQEVASTTDCEISGSAMSPLDCFNFLQGRKERFPSYVAYLSGPDKLEATKICHVLHPKQAHDCGGVLGRTVSGMEGVTGCGRVKSTVLKNHDLAYSCTRFHLNRHQY